MISKFFNLPKKVYYFPLMVNCYNDIFYGLAKRPKSCPGPIRCKVPSIPGLRCALAKRHYKHWLLNFNIMVHYSKNEGGFELSDSGCSV